MSTDHHHDHGSRDEIPPDKKLMKLFSHWIKHKKDHASNYRNWAEKAKAIGKCKAAGLLEEAAESNVYQIMIFELKLFRLQADN